MESFVHNANIANYLRLIAESELDEFRDEDRHKMLLRLLAEEKRQRKKYRAGYRPLAGKLPLRAVRFVRCVSLRGSAC